MPIPCQLVGACLPWLAGAALALASAAQADTTVTRIHQIQGSGPAVTGPGPFTVEAIVVGAYQTQGSGQLRGFFIQEEDADADADPATSEGIFVFCSACPVTVQVGDLVRVTGAASEFFGMSQLLGTATTALSVDVLSSGNSLPTPSTIELPVPGVPAGDLAAARAAINAYYEQFEGMLVRFEDELAIAEYFELARYGQLVLAAGGRPRQFTDQNLPDAGGLIDHQIDFARRTIILDDNNNLQNAAISGGDKAYFWPRPGLSVENFFRGGDTITGLTGVLHWSFAGQTGTDAWRIRPVEPAFSYTFTAVNEPPEAPEIPGSLKVASFNVLNYFLTIDITPSSSVGDCGPTLTADCRGADSATELERQREKLTQALLGLDADVIGLVELENTPGVEPLAAIVDDLNTAGADTYAYIDAGLIGTDAIKVGIIYRTGRVTPVGAYAVLDAAAFVNPFDADVDRNRPAVAQTFEAPGADGRVTVVVNHLKSKGSGCGSDDDDLTTGQGNCNGTRTAAAQALTDWLATDPTGSGDSKVLIIGDLNAYRYEDPITVLKDAGYVDLIDAFQGPDAYSYLFSGQLGYLDYALASPDLAPKVVAAAEWHINADEVPLFDYNDTIRDTGEASFERESTTEELYSPDPYRTSDHDPLIVALDLIPPVVEVSVTPEVLWPPSHRYVEVRATVTASDSDDPSPGIRLVSVTSNEPDNGAGDGNTVNDIVVVDDRTFKLRAERSGNGTGRVYTLTYEAADAANNRSLASAKVSVPLSRAPAR
jgi:predicted extracellular nuclease